MKPKYRVEKVDAQAQNLGGPEDLAACLNACGPQEKVVTVLPFATAAGGTRSFFIVFGPAGSTDPQ